MSLLNSLKPEYRSQIIATRTYAEPPANTPAHIKARMIASMTAYCEKRSVSSFDELLYQDKANHFHSAVRLKQTADIDLRHGKIAAEYRHLSYDQIRRAVRLNYDEDTLLALNLAELGKKLS